MHMDINFKSLVAIGSFNPSILSPEFLKEYCEFRSAHEPNGRNTPVITEIVFGDIQFLMELDKFQVMIKNIEGFDNDYPMDVVLKYFEVLEYTPIKLFGVNYNYTIKGVDTATISQIAETPNCIGEKFGFDPNWVAIKLVKQESDQLKANEIAIKHQFNSDIKNSIEILIKKDSLVINNNFEINNLQTDKSRIILLKRHYQELHNCNNKFVEVLKGLTNE